jgi:DNA-binding NtrC family response regulator
MWRPQRRALLQVFHEATEKVCACLGASADALRGQQSTSERWRITMQWRMLVICSNENRQVIESAILDWSLEVCWCLTLQEARRGLQRGNHVLVLCQAELPDGTYQEVMTLIKHKLDHIRVIVLAEAYSEDSCRQAIELGAFDVISAPYKRTDVQWIIMQAVQSHPAATDASKEGGTPGHPSLAFA